MDRDISICLTSCGRFTELERTIVSLVKFWDGPPPAAFYINEDSGQNPKDLILKMDKLLLANWNIMADWTFSTYAGQVHGLDVTYEQVKTPYIFHCQDDWEFFKTGFITCSRSVLEHDHRIHTVWLRNPDDRNGHPTQHTKYNTFNGVRYQLMAQNYRGVWHGMTWNPGLRRLSDYKEIGKFGSFCKWNKSNHISSEMEYNRRYNLAGFFGATLTQGYVKHIGWHNSTKLMQLK
jgi:hypothetical protein